MTTAEVSTTTGPDIDIDWGGEHVYLRANGGHAYIQLDLTAATADGMLARLVWAASEVRRFQAHVAAGGDATWFDCEPKPGPGGVSDVLAAELERIARIEDGVIDEMTDRRDQRKRELDDAGIDPETDPTYASLYGVVHGRSAIVRKIRERIAELKGGQS